MKNIVNTITESVSPSDIYIILGKGDRGTWPAHTCRVVVISNPSKSLLNALNKKGNKTPREMELIDSLVDSVLKKDPRMYDWRREKILFNYCIGIFGWGYLGDIESDAIEYKTLNDIQ